MIVISNGITSVELDDELDWSDEDYHPFTQAVEAGLTGKPIVDIWELHGMRPITLAAGDSYAWCLWADYLQLRAWAQTPAQELALTLQDRGVSFPRVMFRHNDGEALQHRALVPYTDRQPDDLVVLTRLAFMTLE